MRLCICGGRDYFDSATIYKVLDYAYKKHPFILISGGATGADTIGVRWAKEKDVPHEVYPAQWRLYGKRAGPIRNLLMISKGIDVLIAFPGGVGTNHMVASCELHGVKVVKVSKK